MKIKVYSTVSVKKKILINPFISAVKRIIFLKIYPNLIIRLQYQMINKFNQPANFKANVQLVNLGLLVLVNMKKEVI